MRQAIAAAWRRAVERVAGSDVERADGRCLLPPEWLVVVVNNACNLHCRMCDVGLGETGTTFWAQMIGQRRRNLDPELLARALDQAARFRPRPRIGLASPEPLLHPRIVELVRMAKRRRFFVSVTTNGMLLARLAADLVGAGLDEITVSVDGPPAVHDRIRGKDGSFAALAEGVATLAAARRGGRRPALRLSATINDLNVAALRGLLDAVEPLGAESITIAHLSFITEAMAAAHNAVVAPEWRVSRSNLGPIDPAALDVDACLQSIQAVKRWAAAHRKPRVAFSPELADRDALVTYYRRPDAFVGGRRCTDPWRILMLRSDGTVSPAHSRCYDVPVGHVTQTPLRELWNNAAMRGFRRTLLAAGGTLPACARCCGVVGKPIGEASA